MAKLRVLCLHGYGQAGQALRGKSGALRSESKKLAEWTFVDAPHVITAEQLEARREATGREIGGSGDPCDDLPRTWWNFSDVHHYDHISLDASIETIEEIALKEGPFDGVLGFSQGACFAAMLASRQAQGSLSPDLNFKFVALFSGFLPRDIVMRKEIEDYGVIDLPSFHCFGATDAIITKEQSLEVLFEG